jgi:hypothetical protein
MPTPTHSAALEYAARGWAVFPIEEPVLGNRESGKRPLGKLVPRGKDDATVDPAVINAWWTSCPNANVGIALDKSGLVALDVDVGLDSKGNAKPGRKSLEEFDAELSQTLTAITGGDGLHALYDACSAPIHALKLREGLDIIGHGYIVAAPSLHYTGKRYRWNDIRAIAPVPEVLRRAVAAKRTAVVDKVQLIGTPIGEGGRNIALFKLGAALRDQGLGAEALSRALDAENKQRCNPPLEDAELAVLINSVLQRVTPSRDVAIGAVVDQQVQSMFAPKSRSEWLENVAATPQPPMIWYSTGFGDLDKLLGGGFATRQMAGVMGPPSAGKSALVGHWLYTLAQQRPVLHCSTELPRHELFVRYAAHKMSFPWREGLRGKVAQADMAQAVRGTRIKLLGSEDLDRNDPMGSIEQEAARMAQECGVTPIIAIDYIQMMARGAGTEMRHKVGELTMRGRVLSQVLDTAVIGVLSTGRVVYGGKAAEAMRAANDPTAYLSAAKESGDIEFDCATLMYLDVDKLHEGNPKPGRIAVARCRVGDVGFVGVRAQLDVGKFWCDPAAAAEMSSDARKAQREEDTVDSACKRILEVIAKMPNRPWKEMQAASKLNYNLASTARAKLIDDGVIAQIDRQGYDENRQRLRGTTLVVRSAPPTDAKDEDV